MNQETPSRSLTVGHGLGIFLLMLVAELVVAGITLPVFGFHVMVVVSEALVFLVPLTFLSAAGSSLRKTLSYPRKLGFGFWATVLAATVFLLLVISDITGYIHQLIPRPEAQQKALLEVLVAKSWPEYIFRLLGAAALAGFCEEFAFRGFLQSIFVERLGGVKAILLTAFLFALMHLDPWSFAGVFLLGMFLGYLVYLTGNLWVPMAVHAFSNSLSFSMAFFLPDMGADFSYTFPPYLTLVCALLFIVSVRLIRSKHQDSQPSFIPQG
jgi:membrane protease YdiL (CAAX protease family)